MQQQISHISTPTNVVQYVALPILQEVAPAITPSEVFAILHPNLGTHNEDIEFVLSEISRLQPDESRRGTWLMTQPTFQEWFSSDGSRILLIDGQERERHITSLSYFIATLDQGLHRDMDCVVLSYFCGLHISSDASSSGNDKETGSSVSIMRSLIGQLLVKAQLSFDTRSISHNLLSHVEKHDVGAFCRLFHILVTTCAPSTIFIQLDGISWLESYSQTEVEDAQKVFAAFRALVQELEEPKSYARGQGRGISNVKILLTSARPCMEFQQFFEDACFSMPRSCY
jgi:hypothetical protein